MEKQIQNGSLKDFLFLDLDANMMRKDLYQRLGIKVNAKYFDLSEIEKEVNKNV